MVKKAFKELDKWVSDKGTGGYIDYDYNPYVCINENFLNEELGIQQVREELLKLSHILDVHNLTNGTCLEIGLGFFGSTHFLFRNLFDEVITIEKNFERVREFGRNTKKYYNGFILDDKRSKFYNGFSNDETIVERIYKNHNNINFLFIDGNHTYASALADFLLYYPLVKKGGIIAFHDTVYTEHYNEDVPRLMNDLRNGKYTNNKLDLIDIHESKTQGITFLKK
jgi:cephalosporin hydroxylase